MSAVVASAAVLIEERLVIPERIAFSIPVDDLSRTVAVVLLVRRYESMTPTCYGVQPLIPADWPFSGVGHRAAAACPLFVQATCAATCIVLESTCPPRRVDTLLGSQVRM